MKKRGKLRESGRRSKLEDRFASVLSDLNVPENYETQRVRYSIPESFHTYIVDFTFPNGICIEVKGYLRDFDERHKYELIKEQHPEMDLRFVFDDPNKKITRTKMTHGSWAEKMGFKYCSVHDITTISAWAQENNNNES